MGSTKIRIFIIWLISFLCWIHRVPLSLSLYRSHHYKIIMHRWKCQRNHRIINKTRRSGDHYMKTRDALTKTKYRKIKYFDLFVLIAHLNNMKRWRFSCLSTWITMIRWMLLRLTIILNDIFQEKHANAKEMFIKRKNIPRNGRKRYKLISSLIDKNVQVFNFLIEILCLPDYLFIFIALHWFGDFRTHYNTISIVARVIFLLFAK